MKFPEPRKEKLLNEVQVTASRSGGPGGQNVNKVNTKVELRFPVHSSAELSDHEKQLVALKLKNRITNEGELLVTSTVERSQWKNREKAEKKFLELLEQALTVQKRRKKTQPTTASRMKRIENKKKLSEKKVMRKPPET